jgi:hypothetical protein
MVKNTAPIAQFSAFEPIRARQVRRTRPGEGGMA